MRAGAGRGCGNGKDSRNVGYTQAEQAESPVVEISETGNAARSHPTCGNTHTPRPPPAAGPGKITSIAVSIEQSAADVDKKDQPVCLFRVPRSGLMADSCDIS